MSQRIRILSLLRLSVLTFGRQQSNDDMAGYGSQIFVISIFEHIGQASATPSTGSRLASGESSVDYALAPKFSAPKFRHVYLVHHRCLIDVAIVHYERTLRALLVFGFSSTPDKQTGLCMRLSKEKNKLSMRAKHCMHTEHKRNALQEIPSICDPKHHWIVDVQRSKQKDAAPMRCGSIDSDDRVFRREARALISSSHGTLFDRIAT